MRSFVDWFVCLLACFFFSFSQLFVCIPHTCLLVCLLKFLLACVFSLLVVLLRTFFHFWLFVYALAGGFARLCLFLVLPFLWCVCVWLLICLCLFGCVFGCLFVCLFVRLFVGDTRLDHIFAVSRLNFLFCCGGQHGCAGHLHYRGQRCLLLKWGPFWKVPGGQIIQR